MRGVRNVGQPRAETTVYDKSWPRPVFVIDRGLGGEFSTARDAVFKAARFTAAKLPAATAKAGVEKIKSCAGQPVAPAWVDGR